jgi:hypothetical protein
MVFRPTRVIGRHQLRCLLSTGKISLNTKRCSKINVTYKDFRYPLTTKVVFTFGGLKVDVHSRVLSTTGIPIPGKICDVIIGQYSD